MAVIHDGVTDVHNSDNAYAHVNEATRFDQLMRSYLSSEQGQHFLTYIESRNRKLVELTGYGTADLGPSTVAATIHNGLEGIIVSNYQGKTFQERVEQMAIQYKIPADAMQEYVLTHELAHAAGYKSEAETEGFIKDFFTSRAFQTQGETREKYTSLAKIAAKREYEADQLEE
ncbi:hypothetical protein J4420_02100 [Candidatus Woesearchaeota archaeon]|nr:hypothetical protein [Candidatus Woesearchaeota archaeon]